MVYKRKNKDMDIIQKATKEYHTSEKTLDQVSEEFGLTRGSLYHHYKSMYIDKSERTNERKYERTDKQKYERTAERKNEHKNENKNENIQIIKKSSKDKSYSEWIKEEKVKLSSPHNRPEGDKKGPKRVRLTRENGDDILKIKIPS